MNYWDRFWAGVADSLGLTEPVAQLGGDRVRAYGVDPNTGKLTAPQYGPAAQAAGYDRNDPQGFIKQITDQVKKEYEHDLAQSLKDQPSLGLKDAIVAGVLVIALLVLLGKAL